MTSDTRAAAERFKNVWTSSAELVSEEGELHFDYVRDLATLADAYLAEHPADDGEAVTREWLESAGFKSHCFECKLKGNGTQVIVNMYRPDEPSLWLWNRLLQPNATRGHVRRLCAALGITLNEPTKEQP